MTTETARPVRLADYRPPDHLVEEVALDIHLHPRATEVAARLLIRPNPSGRPGAPLVLDRDGILPARVMIDGRPLSGGEFEVEENQILLTRAPDRPFSLETLTVIDPGANTALSGLYLSDGVFCTQCEAEGFRRITPFPDRPDVLARYRVRLEADKAAARHLLSNGNPSSAGELPGGRHFAIWDDPWPKPSYLFAIVGGNLAVVRDTFVTRSGRAVRIEIYVEEGKEDRCAFALESLKRAMRWDEQAFGREYDLDVFMIVAVGSFNMGAMENKGLNIFNDKYVLSSPETATDIDLMLIEGIIAHEYFHNWTGNRITCRDWFQLSVKEGLTVFRDQEFSADMHSRPVKRIEDTRRLRGEQFTEDSGPLAHPVRPEIYHEIDNFYTRTVYEKGAEVIRMLKTLLGAEVFGRGMDVYFERHDGRAVTVEDFIGCFADVSGWDLSTFMRWYRQAGTPEITAHGVYDAATRGYTLSLRQKIPPTPGQPTKEPMVIPITLGLVGPDGNDIPLVTDEGPLPGGLVVLDEAERSVTFREVPARPVPSLLRHFSAPVRLAIDLSDEDLLFLFANDRDPFNRWQAGQTLMMRHLLAACGARAAGPSSVAIAEALRRVLADERLEPTFLAYTLVPPIETDIAGEITRDIDPDRVLAARRDLRCDLARHLEGFLNHRHAALGSNTPEAPDLSGAGPRALKNTILDLLCAASLPAWLGRARAQCAEAGNMTDRLAALHALCQAPGEAREAALAAFEARHRDDPLVMDKWFSAQAGIRERGTLDRVRALTSHPAFSFANPNRVRALIGAFASNPTEFARPDGAGFDFLADIALMLDARNPQVAARLLFAFRSWRMLEPGRRALAETSLRRIALKTGLSANVGDIVQRALA